MKQPGPAEVTVCRWKCADTEKGPGNLVGEAGYVGGHPMNGPASSACCQLSQAARTSPGLSRSQEPQYSDLQRTESLKHKHVKYDEYSSRAAQYWEKCAIYMNYYL